MDDGLCWSIIIIITPTITILIVFWAAVPKGRCPVGVNFLSFPTLRPELGKEEPDLGPVGLTQAQGA